MGFLSTSGRWYGRGCAVLGPSSPWEVVFADEEAPFFFKGFVLELSSSLCPVWALSRQGGIKAAAKFPDHATPFLEELFQASVFGHILNMRKVVKISFDPCVVANAMFHMPNAPCSVWAAQDIGSLQIASYEILGFELCAVEIPDQLLGMSDIKKRKLAATDNLNRFRLDRMYHFFCCSVCLY